MVELKGYKVNKLEIENRVKPGTQLKLQNQLKYNVNYMDDSKTCVGIMELRIMDADLNPFEIKIDLVAEFTYSDEDSKADIHTTSFDQIFPFVRQIINTATSFTGMPGLMIPIMKLNKETVRVNDKNAQSSPLN
jgi:preprotein translocase subunit SecB